MFDIGWTEILILATISLFIIGPKDIPKFLAYIGSLVAKIRSITYEFRETVDDAIKESELEEIKKEISLSDPEIAKNLGDVLNPKILENENVDRLKNKDTSTKTVNNNEKVSAEYTKTLKKNNNMPSGLKHLNKDESENDDISEFSEINKK